MEKIFLKKASRFYKTRTGLTVEHKYTFDKNGKRKRIELIVK